jgi:hypothetical protein
VTQLDPRRLVAEFAGAAILVFGGAGAAVINSSNPFITAIGFLLALGIAIYLFMGISGAHLNPAVSVSLAAGRHFPWRQVPGYVIAQLLGGIAAPPCWLPPTATRRWMPASVPPDQPWGRHHDRAVHRGVRRVHPGHGGDGVRG